MSNAEIESDESWDTDDGAEDDVSTRRKFLGSFFDADRFNPVYFNDAIVTWTKLPRDVDLPVATFQVESPSKFYVQFVHLRHHLRLLNEKLNEYCEKLEPVDYSYNVNEICMTRRNDQWCRTAVEEKPKMNNEGKAVYKVRFLDFGFTDLADAGDMRPLIRSLLYTPIQAYRCSLHSIIPKDGAWTQHAVEYFKNEISTPKLVKSIRIVEDLGDGRLSVILETEVPAVTKCANIGSLLIKNGFAKMKK